MTINAVLLLFLIFSVVAINGSEIDSFTHRQELFDKYEPVNEAMNRVLDGYMMAAANTANSQIKDLDHNCSSVLLENEIINLIGNVHLAGVIDLVISRVEVDFDKGRSKYYTDSDGKQLTIPILKQKGHSIYDDLRFVKYPIPRLYLGSIMHYKLPSNDSIVIGSDKIGHFFQTGYHLLQKKRESFSALIQDGSSENEAEKGSLNDIVIDYNWNTETGQFGLGNNSIIGTGIRSYGDLVANYDGMKFWQQLTPESSYPRSDNQPYFTCSAEAGWKRTDRLVRTEEFVSAAWDEAINPNEYKYGDSGAVIAEQVDKLFQEGKLPRNSVPIDVRLCKSLVKSEHYPEEHHQLLISPQCLNSILN